MNAAMSKRFGTFFSRVETEREVLSTVNHVPWGAKLHGLTEAAINRWAMEVYATRSNGPELVRQVVHLLHRIAIRAGAHADQSRAVFTGETQLSLPSHDLVDQLRALCSSRVSRGDATSR